MQSTLEETATEKTWHEIAPFLDEALGKLGATDRDAIVLRYFQNKSLQEIGAALGIEERAAQKRVARALEKMQHFFQRRGVTSTTAVIAGILTAHSVEAAPAFLETSVTAVAVAKGASASVATTALVKGVLNTMLWTQIKIIAIAVVLSLVAVAGGFVLGGNSNTGATNTTGAAALTNAASAVTGNRPFGWQAKARTNEYDLFIDHKVFHGGHASASIRSVDEEPEIIGNWMQTFKCDAWRGKRVRMSGFAKTVNVDRFASFWFRVDGPDYIVLSFDNMNDRKIKGTTGWTKYDLVIDVPDQSEQIAFGCFLYGAGQIWMDDVKFEIVEKSVLTTGVSQEELDKGNADAASGKIMAFPLPPVWPTNSVPANLDFEQD